MVSCLFKRLITTNRVRYIRINKKHNLDYFLYFSKNLIFSRFNQDRIYFSQIYEKRITFSSSFRDMTYDYYLKQTLPMCESKLNQILAKNPRLIYRINSCSSNPYTRKNTNQDIEFVNERN